MPRSTHPPAVHRHDRGQAREQRARYIKKRWRRNKDLYGVDERTGALTLDMSNRRVVARCGPAMLDELAVALGQAGPLLFLHPEALRRADKDLRRSVEKFLGLKVLGANELSEGASAHDRGVDAAGAHHHDRLMPVRAAQKRGWRKDAVADAAA